MTSLGSYWHTVRYLRPIQIVARGYFRLARPKPRSVIAGRRGAPVRWSAPIAKPQSLFGPTQLQFLNETHDISELGWDSSDIAKLWRYNLHYFDDLTSSTADERRFWHAALIKNWIEANPPGRGTGWEPYPTSLRIVNWVKWLLAGNEPPEGMLASLATQADWLTRRLEYHLLGNHLFSNGKALAFAGHFMEGPSAARWAQKGVGILRQQIREQVLNDGGHFELSPMYHAIAVEDVLDLANLELAYPRLRGGGIVPAGLATRMLNWLALMSHPDGDISFFNDGALGIAPSLAVLCGYAARLGEQLPPPPKPGLVHLTESGYIRLQDDDIVCLIDVAAIGPDYLPGHSHADTLSFELSLGGKRLLVNSGTSEYGGGRDRLRQRGTAAHNSVVVDGADSSEVWSSFRVARRAYPKELLVNQERDGWTVTCSHTGYTRLAGKPVHTREWKLKRGSLTVTDSFSGRVTTAEAHFHFSPAVRIERRDERSFIAAIASKSVIIAAFPPSTAHLAQGTWHPEFGKVIANQHLVVRSAGESIATCIGWRQ